MDGADVTLEPRAALQDNEVFRLYRHYVDTLAPWYDINDPDMAFSTELPIRALDDRLLFCAVLAFSAAHQSVTTRRLKNRAKAYHELCVKDLVHVKDTDERISNGVILAATCLLRSYEILAGQFRDCSLGFEFQCLTKSRKMMATPPRISMVRHLSS